MKTSVLLKCLLSEALWSLLIGRRELGQKEKEVKINKKVEINKSIENKNKLDQSNKKIENTY